MKKIIFILILILFPTSINAAFLSNEKSTYKQPNNETITIYTTGDEYFRYSHDKNGNVIMLDNNGYFVYAKLDSNGKVVPSTTRVTSFLPTINTIKADDIDLTINTHLIKSYSKTPLIQNKTKKRSQMNGSTDNVLNFKNTIIFIRFKDETDFTTPTFMQSVNDVMGLSSIKEDTVKTYVEAVSNGNVNLDNTVVQNSNNNYFSYESPYQREYLLQKSTSNPIGFNPYITNDGEKRLHVVLKDAIKSLPLTLKNNIDGNNDGHMDNITFILSGSSSGIWSDPLWPHMWNLSAFGIADAYSGARPYSYTLQFANDVTPTAKSVFSHEMMHSLGIDDLYRYQDTNNGDPVGAWDMMNQNREGTFVNTYIRYLQGTTNSYNTHWVNAPKTITESGTYILTRSTLNQDNASYLIETNQPNQYIQLEYRKKDLLNGKHDKFIPKTSVLVSRLDNNYIGNTWNNYNKDQYYIYRQGDNTFYGAQGGGGNLYGAGITPCTTTPCTNSYGTRLKTATLNQNAITYTDGSNTEIIVKNVKEIDSDRVSVDVFVKDDDMYLNHTSYEGKKGEKFKLTPTFESTTYAVTYESTSPNIVSVDQNGNVILLDSGTSTIKVFYNGKTETCKVTSYSASIEKITPTIIDAKNVKVDFTLNGEANSFSIYRSLYENDSYTKIGTSTTTSFIDNTVQFGKTYYYKVAISIKNELEEFEILSSINNKIDTLNYLPTNVTNVATTLENPNKAIINFNPVSDAVGYNIYRSNTIDGTYSLIGSNTNNSYIDESITFGQIYYYKVSAYKITDENKYEGKLTEPVVLNTKDYLLHSPSISNIEVINNQEIKLSYNELGDATSYNIYRSTSTNDDSFVKIASSYTSTIYNDKNLVAGITYYYKVSANRVANEKQYNGFRSNYKSVYVNTPSITNVTISSNTYNSLKISFEKQTNVSGYEIYYSNSKTGKYYLLKTTSSNSYTHTSLKTNTYYYYKVRSYVKIGTKSVYSSYSSIYYNKPIPSKTSIAFSQTNTNTIKLTYKQVVGANKYSIYYKEQSVPTYTLLGTTSSLSYTINNVSKKTTYDIKVVPYLNSIKGEETITSYQVAPIIPTGVKVINDGISSSTITWTNNIEADGYKLYRKYGNINEEIADLKTNTYNDTNLQLGVLYSYYVKAYYSLDDKTILSSNSPTVNTVVLPKQVEDVNIVTKTPTTIEVTFKTNESVTGYRLLKSTSKTGAYSLVATSNTNKITYTKATPNVNYYYKVEPYIIVNNVTTIGKVTEAVVHKTLPLVVTNLSINNSTYNSLKISYGKMPNINGYQIYYSRTLTGTYSLLKETTSSYYIHTNLGVNKEYYYKVRSYVLVGKTKIYSPFTEIKMNKPLPNKTTVTFNPLNTSSVNIAYKQVLGATSYQILISEQKEGEYKTLANTKSLSYNVTSLEKGKTYYFKIIPYYNNIIGEHEVKEYTATLSSIKDLKATKVSKTEVKLTFTNNIEATNYEIYRKVDSSYQKIADIINNEYIDNVKIGINYSYYVKAYIDGEKKLYAYNSNIINYIYKPDTVTNVKITSIGGSTIKVNFTQSQDATGYNLLRATSYKGPYTKVAYSKNNEIIYNKVKPGVTYYYQVEPYVTYNSTTTKGLPTKYASYKLVPPTLTNLKTDSYSYNSLKVSFDKQTNVSGYEIYYSTSKTGKYYLLKTTTSNYYIHSKLKVGKDYYYKVRSYVFVGKTKVYSSYSSCYGKPIPSAPIISLSNINPTSIKVSYKAVSGATYYKIYRKQDSDYTLVATTKSLSFTDTNLSKNTEYTYKVVSTYGSIIGKTSNEGKVKTLPITPTNIYTSASTTKNDEVFIKWDKQTGVDGYQLYLEDNLIYDGLNNSYVDQKLITGQKYTYTLNSYILVDGNKITSKTSRSYTVVPKPLKVGNIKVSLANTYTNFTVTFDKSEKATGYNLLRSTSSNGSYVKVASSLTNSITYTPTPGVKYYYKVEPYIILNGYAAVGESISFSYSLVPPNVSTLSVSNNTYNSNKIIWNKVDNVSGYELYYKTSKTGKYYLLKTLSTNTTSYIHYSLTPGRTYYYNIRSYKTISGKKIYSSYKTDVSIVAKPLIASNVKASRYNYYAKKGKISWSSQSGVSGYEIYKSTNNKDYSLLTRISTNSYLDQKISSKYNYYYKVRAYKTVGKTRVYGSFSTYVVIAKPEAPNFKATIFGGIGFITERSVLIENDGSKSLKILGSNAFLESDYFYIYDRELFLYDNENGANLLSITLNPLTDEIIVFKVNGTSTYYETYSTLYFDFIYDGVKYQAQTSEVYGDYYVEY